MEPSLAPLRGPRPVWGQLVICNLLPMNMLLLQIMLNGSHSMHALSPERGMAVASPSGGEELHILGLDAPLVALGLPRPMPNACVGPDMTEGVSWNLVNNVWGTNYPMWVPWSDEEVNMAFRFVLEVHSTAGEVGGCAQLDQTVW